jgi:hypothetical protein
VEICGQGSLGPWAQGRAAQACSQAFRQPMQVMEQTPNSRNLMRKLYSVCGVLLGIPNRMPPLSCGAVL